MSDANRHIWDELHRVLWVIPQKYVEAILVLHEKLEGKSISWSLNGNLAEALRTVQVEPECIEIVSSKGDVEQIFEAVKEFQPQPLIFKTQLLSRNAVIGEKEYPIHIRSHFFEFNIKETKVKVHGDLQYQVGDWEWGDVFAFDPEYVYVIGKKIAITPLAVKCELYSSLGWVDRAEKIKRVLQRTQRHSSMQP
jgi:hypothetical protein